MVANPMDSQVDSNNVPFAIGGGGQDKPRQRGMRAVQRHTVQIDPAFGLHFAPSHPFKRLLVHVNRAG